MRRTLTLALVFLALPAAAELPAPVAAALAASGVPPAAVGVVVMPAEGGPARVAHNADLALNPASVMKLVTTYAALELLGPAYTFKTRFVATGKVAGGVLEGDLVIRGGGDPKLTYERLWQAAHELRSRGVREIRGDVVLDRGFFAPVAHDPAKFDNDARRAYNVGPDALLVNYKAVNFRFVPTEAGLRITAEPDLPNVEIATRVQLVSEPCTSFRRNLRHQVQELGLLATIQFEGTYPASCGERTWALSVLEANAFSESTVRWVFGQAGTVLRGKVRPGSVPVEAHIVHVHESDALAVLVRDINKHSNNVMARQLFLTLSAEKLSVPGEAGQSGKLVTEWLKGRGVVAPELVMENGSGLSRTERASAATIAALLVSAWRSPVMPEFMASLPVTGVDGTLKSRDAVATGRAHLKGGTLTGVQAVAGYVLDARGRRWVVVMIANHENANRAQAAMDTLVNWVHRGTR